jgi:hypothetical protein
VMRMLTGKGITTDYELEAGISPSQVGRPRIETMMSVPAAISRARQPPHEGEGCSNLA